MADQTRELADRIMADVCARVARGELKEGDQLFCVLDANHKEVAAL